MNYFKKYIISANSKQEAVEMAKERGLKPQQIYYVQITDDYEIIRDKLRGITVLNEMQLIGYFSMVEREYLTRR